MAAIRSHKIPRAYLKRFASTAKRGKGKLWVYERGRPPRIGTPKSEAAERGFFSRKLADGSLDDTALEAWAQKIEDRALESLCYADNHCFVWTDPARTRVAEYWALLFARSSATFDFHRRLWDEALSQAGQRVSSDAAVRQRLAARYTRLAGRSISEREVLDSFQRVVPNLKDEAEMRHAYLQQLQRRTKLFSRILLRKPWQVWLAPAHSEFVTCDSPVVTMRVDEHGRCFLGWGFGRDRVLALMPISYRGCVVAGAVGPPSRVITKEDIREINKSLVFCAFRFVYSRSLDQETDRVVQQGAGSIRYGVDAFKTDAFDVLDLFG